LRPDLRGLAGATLLLLATLTACGANDPGTALRPAPKPATTIGRTATPTSASTASSGGSTSRSTRLGDELSLPGLMGQEFVPGRLELVEEVGSNAAFTRTRVTYDSGGLTISGMLLRPRGDGPFPGIVLNHGFIEPSTYRTGQGLLREQERLVRAGFVVLHTDYRGHAESDDPKDPFDRASRVGYARDSIQAVLALRQESYVDPERMAMFGKSMGGAVTLNALVAAPGVVRAAVIYSSMSSSFVENVEHFANEKDAREFYEAFGMPERSPEFYARLSPRTYFDRISASVLLHHGSADRVCPYRWSVATHRLLSEAGVDSELVSWPGEEHAFDAAWEAAMDRSIEFLFEQLEL
jgi:dipeptidyl aminopeptidase/acylaminoacyl peptidase